MLIVLPMATTNASAISYSIYKDNTSAQLTYPLRIVRGPIWTWPPMLKTVAEALPCQIQLMLTPMVEYTVREKGSWGFQHSRQAIA